MGRLKSPSRFFKQPFHNQSAPKALRHRKSGPPFRPDRIGNGGAHRALSFFFFFPSCCAAICRKKYPARQGPDPALEMSAGGRGCVLLPQGNATSFRRLRKRYMSRPFLRIRIPVGCCWRSRVAKQCAPGRRRHYKSVTKTRSRAQDRLSFPFAGFSLFGLSKIFPDREITSITANNECQAVPMRSAPRRRSSSRRRIHPPMSVALVRSPPLDFIEQK